MTDRTDQSPRSLRYRLMGHQFISLTALRNGIHHCRSMTMTIYINVSGRPLQPPEPAEPEADGVPLTSSAPHKMADRPVLTSAGFLWSTAMADEIVQPLITMTLKDTSPCSMQEGGKTPPYGDRRTLCEFTALPVLTMTSRACPGHLGCRLPAKCRQTTNMARCHTTGHRGGVSGCWARASYCYIRLN